MRKIIFWIAGITMFVVMNMAFSIVQAEEKFYVNQTFPDDVMIGESFKQITGNTFLGTIGKRKTSQTDCYWVLYKFREKKSNKVITGENISICKTDTNVWALHIFEGNPEKMRIITETVK